MGEELCVWGGGGGESEKKRNRKRRKRPLAKLRMSQGGYKTPSFHLSSEERSSRSECGEGEGKEEARR
jgi:hypothetical protein